MRLTARMLVAALAALALAVSGGAALADPPEEHRSCPNNRDWILFPNVFDLEKDNNGDGQVCVKADSMAVKDNNNPPNDDDVVDNEYPFLDLLGS